MDSIAVVDDRQQQRESIVRAIQRELRRQNVGWEVIGIAPLAEIDGYREWLLSNEVRVLVLDQKLDEEIGDGPAVQYSGHDAATAIRKECPDFPSLIVTAFSDDDDLEDANDLDAVVGRNDFIARPGAHVARMVRMGRAYIDRNEEALAELTRLSEKLVVHGLSEDERQRMDALRQKAQMSSIGADMEGLRSWLIDAHRIEGELRAVLSELGKKD